ncbi:MAG: class II aldolase/adducin family protein [Pseudomonadota bacterium]
MSKVFHSIQPGNSPSDPLQQTRQDLALAHRIVAYENMHEGTWTHLSAMIPGSDGLMLVSPGFQHFADVQADDLVIMDSAGKVVDNTGDPNPAAWCLHYPLHTARPDAACVIHLHSLHASALLMQEGVCLDEQSSQVAATLYQQIAYYDVYDGVLREADEGYRMAEVLGDKAILALRNHGYMAVGSSVGAALERAYNFERACQLQLLATAGGQTMNRIPDHIVAEVARTERETLGGYFSGMKAMFDRTGR